MKYNNKKHNLSMIEWFIKYKEIEKKRKLLLFFFFLIFFKKL